MRAVCYKNSHNKYSLYNYLSSLENKARKAKKQGKTLEYEKMVWQYALLRKYLSVASYFTQEELNSENVLSSPGIFYVSVGSTAVECSGYEIVKKLNNFQVRTSPIFELRVNISKEEWKELYGVDTENGWIFRSVFFVAKRYGCECHVQCFTKDCKNYNNGNILTDNAAKETLDMFNEYKKDDTSLYKILNEDQYSKLIVSRF